MAKYRIVNRISEIPGNSPKYFYNVEIKKFWWWNCLMYFSTLTECHDYISFHKNPVVIYVDE